MYTPICLSRLLALFLCIVFPLYLASRGSNSLSDVARLLSNLAQRTEALHVALTSPLARPSASIARPVVESSAEPNKITRSSKDERLLADGLAHAINSFEQYASLAEQVLQRKHARYVKQTPAQKALSRKLDYPAHFDKARQGINKNAHFSEQIAQIAREHYSTGQGALEDPEDAELGLVNLAFSHLSRDWSAQGAKERHVAFPPLLAALEQHFGGNAEGKKVLVPGSGTGRLASDIADLGYDVTANDLDYSSILTYHFLTNHTDSLHQHILQPFVTKWAHQANHSSRYSTLTVPDHWPNKTVKLVEGDFLEVFPDDEQFDAVVTLFFIDISDNVIDFLSNIHRLLKPGGAWINLGPLKWGSHTALQLSAVEVLHLADLIGFDVDHASLRSLDSLYAEQPDTLLKFTYVTQFWTAKKRM
ncbi:Carnosine N-methyltransferase [Colletotrichum spinosum]|uniref:Carnosine N-methyltransferase n=1 Tax=Colletotrichum spinosum TaxID=1347390 RepID=A0A4R8QIA5_9PEZI|nr:Carnosine N-methyltransferase [Colletotrichum spinosum]